MRVAVVVSGCGYMDGSEISETILTLLALGQSGVEYDVFAPDMDFQAFNHISGSLSGEMRNAIVESARLARDVTALDTLDIMRYSALVLPGGYGVIRNLSTIFEDKANAQPLPAIHDAITGCHKGRKPILGVCVAPVLVALCLKNMNISITSGLNIFADSGNSGLYGNTFIPCKSDSFVEDKEHKIISTPAYMNKGVTMVETYEGISKAIKALVRMLSH